MTLFLEIHSAHVQLNFAEFCRCADVSQPTMLAMVQHEIAIPLTGAEPQQWLFEQSCIQKVQKAARLYRDLDIDWADLYLVLNLLEEIDQLKNENKKLKQQLERISPA
jgi:chaperone modulatory protein CbpM